ncbi:MAG TPA: 50S ribosomal protein L22 [Candidatus Saccharimonadales bacterium]|nr:50S ribosomal protein L22 [Candidatus Saccharimonadales bacterium]
MPATAHSKGVRISPRKVAVVADLVRGRSVEDALTILDFTPRRAAGPVKEAIKSAAANAEHNHSYKPGTLEIVEISVTAGPRLKRYIPAARGRARRFQRKTSHIKIVVDGQKRENKKTAKAAETEKETK